jgi:hypothetical protein
VSTNYKKGFPPATEKAHQTKGASQPKRLWSKIVSRQDYFIAFLGAFFSAFFAFFIDLLLLWLLLGRGKRTAAILPRGIDIRAGERSVKRIQ